MVTLKLFVEGGGDAKTLRTACRQGFTEFLKKYGLMHRPRILACGSRRNAYDDFCTAVNNGEAAMLLVDSEAAIAADCQQGAAENWQPWKHLAQRPGDQWQKPASAGDDQCHLMVQCMEAWFIADRATLKAFFGQGFKDNALPPSSRPVDEVPKQQLYDSLKRATQRCKTKDVYGKGEHSFDLLARIDSKQVEARSNWARRFLATIRKKMDGT